MLLAKIASALSREGSVLDEKNDEPEPSEAASEDRSSTNKGMTLLKRKMSKWSTGKKGIGALFGPRHSVQEIVKYENTYKMEPDEDKRLRLSKIKTMVDDILQLHLKDYVYEPKTAARLCQKLTDEIKKKVKLLPCTRYKYVVHVTIGQKHGQGFVIGSRCLWDDKKDNFYSSTFENGSLFATAALFGTYTE